MIISSIGTHTKHQQPFLPKTTPSHLPSPKLSSLFQSISNKKDSPLPTRMKKSPAPQMSSRLALHFPYSAHLEFRCIQQAITHPFDATIGASLSFFSHEKALHIVKEVVRFWISHDKPLLARTFVQNAQKHVAINKEILLLIEKAIIEKDLRELSAVTKQKIAALSLSINSPQSNISLANACLTTTSALMEKIAEIKSHGSETQTDQINKACLETMNQLLDCIMQIRATPLPTSSDSEKVARDKRLELCLLAASFSDCSFAEMVEEPLEKIQENISALHATTATDPQTVYNTSTTEEIQSLQTHILKKFDLFEETIRERESNWSTYTHEELVSALSYLCYTKEGTPRVTNISYEKEALLATQELHSVSSLVEEFRSRPWSDAISITNSSGQTTVRGFLPGIENQEAIHRSDQERLLKILQAHNQQFRLRAEKLCFFDTGHIEKLEEEVGTKIYIRADLHSDLATLLAQLTFFQEANLLDKNYRCKPGFKMVFLGDFCDRGCNDIEVLTLILRLRMENPSSVFLVKGNHENAAFQVHNSNESAWIRQHLQDLDFCYKTFPLAVCIGNKTSLPEEDREYIHCSHALFSTAVDVAPLLESEKNLLSVSSRPFDEFTLAMTSQKKSAKQQQAYADLSAHTTEADDHPDAYVWSDLSSPTGPSTYRSRKRQLSPEDAYNYFLATSARRRKIKMTIHGHSHLPLKHIMLKKDGINQRLIGFGLPVGHIGGWYGLNTLKGYSFPIDGFLVEVAPKVKNWGFLPTKMEGEGKNSRLTFVSMTH